MVLFSIVHRVIKMEVLKVGLPGRVMLLGVFNDEMRGGCCFICGFLSKKSLSVGLCSCLREF